jgi:hypothetical protein
MDTPDPGSGPGHALDRLTALERLQAQQERLNALLIELTSRLGDEQGHHAEALFRADVAVTRLEQGQTLHDRILGHLAQDHILHREAIALHAERLERYDAILTRLDEESARHAQRLERLDTILQAIKDLLDRGNGH